MTSRAMFCLLENSRYGIALTQWVITVYKHLYFNHWSQGFFMTIKYLLPEQVLGYFDPRNAIDLLR